MSALSPKAHQASAHAFHIGRRVTAGVAGGAAGGLVFGMLMAMMGMLPVVASLVGSNSAAVGFGVHMVISVLIGLGLTVPFSRFLHSYGRGIVTGLAYGVVWWVLGGLLLMPAALGMAVFTLDMSAVASLMGHLVYGLVLALVAVPIMRRSDG